MMKIPKDLSAFGKEFRKFCIDADTTPERVASALKVPLHVIRCYEKGQAPKVEFLDALAEWIRDSIDWSYHSYASTLYECGLSQIHEVKVSTIVSTEYARAAIDFNRCLEEDGLKFAREFRSSLMVRSRLKPT